VDTRSGIDEQLDSFRRARRDIEASVLPLATSLDGRRFTFQASLYALQLQVGGYAVLEDGGVLRLGRVLALELDQQPANAVAVYSAHAGGDWTRRCRKTSRTLPRPFRRARGGQPSRCTCSPISGSCWLAYGSNHPAGGIPDGRVSAKVLNIRVSAKSRMEP
jgi:hypothetical protein